jgi:hypothetical protein
VIVAVPSPLGRSLLYSFCTVVMYSYVCWCCCCCRGLSSNQLAGTLPASWGDLTTEWLCGALSFLDILCVYPLAFCIHVSLHCSLWTSQHGPGYCIHHHYFKCVASSFSGGIQSKHLICPVGATLARTRYMCSYVWLKEAHPARKCVIASSYVIWPQQRMLL